ncbi:MULTISPECIES: FAD-binding oxidoreductase [Paraburkholderia]|uniref:FAD-binding oxidoreductase n=1 Tax=Paraburkholderia dipogonis TaxID=1211383 RepID=A0A4Y8MHT3_9BURK|nr:MULTISPECIES: FAD-binding oxidoreductase [Paraburkholderia]RKR31380.1 FAD/FMN-containing dehydrogenase [Paraburkholderia sp. BL17N1]TFE37036.1 FAD-binding oxidoreductase [Paraburkholderia dipogonis]
MDSRLNSLRDAFSGRLLTADNEMSEFLTDYRGRWHGRALAVAQPDTTQDVASVLRWSNTHRVPVVPQGGNTGLSGGSVPDGSGDAIVLSLQRLNRIRALDPFSNTLVVEAGVTLLAVQEAARDAGRLFPLSLAAEGSCTIGGNLATNAGGVQVLRYGNARDLCLGLEVVTQDGEIWNGLRALRKDNTGYDLRDLFIGAEGTLGVITAAVLKLSPLPAARVVALTALPSPDAALRLLSLAQGRAGDALSAFELLSDLCIDLVERHVPGTRQPFDTAYPWYALLELSDAGSEAHALDTLQALLAEAIENGDVADAVVATSLSQFDALWALRENISEAQATEGKNIKHDISLPISRIPAFIEYTGHAIAQSFPDARLVVFGHLGDGNLHYNASPAVNRLGSEHEQAFMALEGRLNRLVHDAVHAFDGSLSAEHGLGVLRRDEAARYKEPVELRMMRAIKQALDPLNLMNPAKVLNMDSPLASAHQHEQI